MVKLISFANLVFKTVVCSAVTSYNSSSELIWKLYSQTALKICVEHMQSTILEILKTTYKVDFSS